MPQAPLVVDHTVCYDQFLTQLALRSYRRSSMVFERGEYALRGHNVDVFPVNHTHPLRLEFEDQKLVRMQAFATHTQRSQGENLAVAKIYPFVAEDPEFFGLEGQPDMGAAYELLSALKPGAPVVHVFHGIGLFEGLRTTRLGPLEGEFLLIRYKGSDKLYVPLNQIGNVHAYSGHEHPTLHSLSDGRWLQTVDRVRTSTENIAQELLDLYRRRHQELGFQFGDDDAGQLELEASFPFEETADQRKVIADVKRDMEAPFPMDRLVCGDVGFGKTELALRAAFKAVAAGKQVSVLVPTTVLAEQHFLNFNERLKTLGVNVAVLCRLQNRSQQLATIQRISAGQVDVVIGTHRLLQKDVHFKDLGLLIVDEEQRFGVLHKERLKQRYPRVDVLCMSATPIPRTLYLSLAGTRDLSLLEAAPQARLPIRTFLSEFKPQLIKKGIQAELARQGQVYFVHNRVDDIEPLLRQLKALVPQARYAVAHGQMSARALEATILQFLRGQVDVLLCTTIVENGIDVPNANTIFINHADQMGLSQIHQLRGRVGRSQRQAVAYLLYAVGKQLGAEATDRLQAIREYTALGSGYRIAVKDLELRGAGHVLGTAQSGNWIDVGLQLYLDILQESMERAAQRPAALRRVPELFELDVKIPNFIPADYVADERERLALYQRLMRSRTRDDIAAVREDLCDRYGKMPKVVDRLLLSLLQQVERRHDCDPHDDTIDYSMA